MCDTLRLLTPPMETPDPPNDTPGALKQVVLTPHDIPWSLRVILFPGSSVIIILSGPEGCCILQDRFHHDLRRNTAAVV